jgi:hypothetical protein
MDRRDQLVSHDDDEDRVEQTTTTTRQDKGTMHLQVKEKSPEFLGDSVLLLVDFAILPVVVLLLLLLVCDEVRCCDPRRCMGHP